jgi:hypothetical protein
LTAHALEEAFKAMDTDKSVSVVLFATTLFVTALYAGRVGF